VRKHKRDASKPEDNLPVENALPADGDGPAYSLEDLTPMSCATKAFETTDAQVREMNLVLRLAAEKLSLVDGPLLERISDEQREELLANIAALEQQEIRLGRRCPYCRSNLSEDLGVCANCGRPSCNKCGHLVEGAVLHQGNCTMYYQGQK